MKMYPKSATPRPQEGVMAARGDGAVSSIISSLIAKGGSVQHLLDADALGKLRRLEPAVAEIEELVAEYEALGVALRGHRGLLEQPLKKIKPTLSKAEAMLDYVVERQTQMVNLPHELNPFFEPSWAGKKLHTMFSSLFHASRAGATTRAAKPDTKSRRKKLDKVESFIEKALKDFNRSLPPELPTTGHPPPKVIGRDAECRKIVAKLYGTQQDDDEDEDQYHYHHGRPYSVMGIHGPAGSGKTTLAQRAYARAQEDEENGSGFFNLFIWVHVGRQSTLQEVFDDMMKAASDNDRDNVPLQRRSLQDELRGKRVLLVLDDVRCNGTADLKEILSPLDVVESGSKVLLTARSVDALLALGAAKSGCLPIRELDDDVFLRLFMHYALGDDGVDERDRGVLQDIGADIAGKLKRSPLAAKLVGEELRATPNIDSWRRVQDKISNRTGTKP